MMTIDEIVAHMKQTGHVQHLERGFRVAYYPDVAQQRMSTLYAIIAQAVEMGFAQGKLAAHDEQMAADVKDY